MRKHALKGTIPDAGEFRELLRKRSMRATPQRMAVHEAMSELVHASADMVFDHISANASCKVTTASVYNILSQLTDAGLYSRRMGAGSRMFFDVRPYAHVHLYDTRNDEFMDVMDEELLELVTSRMKSKRFKGYKVDRIDIQLVAHPTRKSKKTV